MKDYTGIKNNMLTAIRFCEIKNGRVFWEFNCDCGAFIKQRVDKILSKKPQVTSCGCTRKKSFNDGLNTDDRLINHIYFKYRQSAKRRNYSFELSINFFSVLVKSDCFYCGSKPNRVQYNQSKKRNFIFCNGVDRKNNNIGYTEENCVSCCTICNRAKSNFSFDFFIEWIKNLKSHSKI